MEQREDTKNMDWPQQDVCDWSYQDETGTFTKSNGTLVWHWKPSRIEAQEPISFYIYPITDNDHTIITAYYQCIGPDLPLFKAHETHDQGFTFVLLFRPIAFGQFDVFTFDDIDNTVGRFGHMRLREPMRV